MIYKNILEKLGLEKENVKRISDVVCRNFLNTTDKSYL